MRSMRRLGWPIFACLTACAVLAWVPGARAHGIVGNRFFPPTITTDDPFAADELALPTLSWFENPDSPPTREIDAGFEFSKLIFPKLALGVSDTYSFLKPKGQNAVEGWNNLELSLKRELWTSQEHEAIISIGLDVELGGTGSHAVGADDFSTYTPTFFWGKGFGDLPDSLWALQPLAITGTLGQSFPARAESPNVLQWGLAVEYSLPYLQQHVKDVGLPAPFRNMIPLVEFSFQTAENRGQGGVTTGTINPGVLWESRYVQIGVEALIPINSDSGDHVGVMVQMFIFVDDLFPKVFGHPLFGD